MTTNGENAFPVWGRIYVQAAKVPVDSYRWQAWKKSKWLEPYVKSWWQWLSDPQYTETHKAVRFSTKSVKELLYTMIRSYRGRGLTPALIVIPWSYRGLIEKEFNDPLPSVNLNFHGVAVTFSENVSSAILLTKDDLP